MQRRDSEGRIRLLSNDAETVRGATELVEPALAARTIVAVDADRDVFTGARAIFVIAGRTGGFVGLVGRMLSPRSVSMLFEPGYRLFARNRGRFARWFRE